MPRSGYTALGYLVFNGAKLYMRRRYGDKPKKAAAGSLVVAGVLVLAAVVAKRDSLPSPGD